MHACTITERILTQRTNHTNPMPIKLATSNSPPTPHPLPPLKRARGKRLKQTQALSKWHKLHTQQQPVTAARQFAIQLHGGRMVGAHAHSAWEARTPSPGPPGPPRAVLCHSWHHWPPSPPGASERASDAGHEEQTPRHCPPPPSHRPRCAHARHRPTSCRPRGLGTLRARGHQPLHPPHAPHQPRSRHQTPQSPPPAPGR
jgi:hypothetical protein